MVESSFDFRAEETLDSRSHDSSPSTDDFNVMDEAVTNCCRNSETETTSNQQCDNVTSRASDLALNFDTNKNEQDLSLIIEVDGPVNGNNEVAGHKTAHTADATVIVNKNDSEESRAVCRSPQMISNEWAPNLRLPEIAVQTASPMVLSPTEDEVELHAAMDNYNSQAWVDMDEVCAKADKEVEAEREEQEINNRNSGSQQNLCEIEVRPLSPADYTLDDDSDLPQIYDPVADYSTNDRLPSPSQYSLLVDSVEESELIRLTSNAIPDDVFAIPEPAVPNSNSHDLNMYLECQYGKHDQDVGVTNDADLVEGTVYFVHVVLFVTGMLETFQNFLSNITIFSYRRNYGLIFPYYNCKQVKLITGEAHVAYGD
jgi:hypothetical protein